VEHNDGVRKSTDETPRREPETLWDSAQPMPRLAEASTAGLSVALRVAAAWHGKIFSLDTVERW
jgi:hypothetical protein